MSGVTPRSLRSRGLASNEASPIPSAPQSKLAKPKKRDRSPALEAIQESPIGASSETSRVLPAAAQPLATQRTGRTAKNTTSWPASGESVDGDSPEHPLAASFYGAAPFRGVNELHNHDSLASTASSSAPSTVTTQMASAAPVIDYANFNSIANGLTQLASLHNIPELSTFAKHYSECTYYTSLDDYQEAWNYSTALHAFIERKCCDLPNITNKQTRKEPKSEKKEKIEYKLGDKIEWDVSEQVFSVCVPCFEAGRVPTRCIFLRKVGFVNHRRVNVFDRSATTFERCKRPSEDVGAIACYDAYLERAVLVNRVNRRGYAECDYRLFRLPALRQDWSCTQFECVANESKSEGLKWARVEGTHFEHNLTIPFCHWIKKLIAGDLPDCIVNPAEEAAAAKAADKISTQYPKPAAPVNN